MYVAAYQHMLLKRQVALDEEPEREREERERENTCSQRGKRHLTKSQRERARGRASERDR